MLACHFRGRVDLPKEKYKRGSCLINETELRAVLFELDPTGSRAKKSTSGASKELGFRLRRANSHTHDARAAHQTANGDLETLGPWRYTRPKDTEPLTLVRGWLYYTAILPGLWGGCR